MNKKSSKPSAFFDPRVFISFLLVFGAVLLVFAAFGVSPATTARAQGLQQNRPPARAALQTRKAQALAAVCHQPPTDMVSWWILETNGTDIYGPNNGSPDNSPAFVPGQAGQALR